MIYLSAYTIGTPYEQEANELRKTLDKHHLPSILFPYKNRGTWERNCSIKPEAVRTVMLEQPVTWLDADARVLKFPSYLELLPKTDWTVCAHYRQKFGHELLSGTITFNNNARAFELLIQWEDECKAQPDVWDQRILQRIIERERINVLPLPASYISIAGAEDMPQPPDAVIQHLQRSNKFKSMINQK